jgi:purine-binding chemotaxis protein CheW
VQALHGHDLVTQIANAPAFIKNVVNLHGVIVPIVDMRIKFKLGTPTYDQCTVVIILNIAGHSVGMVVDNILDVTTLTAEQIKPASGMGAAFNANYLIGRGALGKAPLRATQSSLREARRMPFLIDIEKLMSSDEMGLIEKLAA